MALELMLEDKISFEATECNHLMLFKKRLYLRRTFLTVTADCLVIRRCIMLTADRLLLSRYRTQWLTADRLVLSRYGAQCNVNR